jgi:hypothetical protein
MKNRKTLKGKNIITDAFSNMYKDVSKVGNNMKKTAAMVLNKGYTDYPIKLKNILKNYGKYTIIDIKIGRTPVTKVLTEIMNVVSLGQFNQNMKDIPQDRLFHLFIIVKLDNNTTIRIEKNEVLNMDINRAMPSDAESKEVKIVPQNITLSELLENGRKIVGDDKFFRYSARDANCQDFITALFNGSNIGDDSDRTFIKQNTKQLFENTGVLRKLSNSITDAGAIARILSGGDIDIKEKGDNGLTDKQLMDMCKELKIQCHGCFIKDELKELKNGNYIINLNGRSHWTALIKKGPEVIYFDSYGFPAPEDIEDLIEGNYFYNNFEVQGLKQTSCGYYCLALLKYVKDNKNKDLFNNFMEFLDRFGRIKEDNQKTIGNMLNS